MSGAYTYEQLIAKIVRAKIALERVPAPSHANTCPIEDPGSYAPCRCRAGTTSRALDEVRAALEL